MSFDAALWAIKDAPVANVEEYAILIVQGEAADEDGCNAFQSMGTIAERTRLDEKTVKRRLAAMESRGLIRRGDQQYPLLLKIRADRRPVNYDLMIPRSWWGGKWERMNRWRVQDRGRPALTDQDRPDLAPAPVPEPRADKKPHPDPPDGGTTRPPVDEGTASPPVDEGTARPPVDVDGWTAGPPRGDCGSVHGGTASPPTKPINKPNPKTQSQNLPPASRATGGGTGGAALFDVDPPPPTPPSRPPEAQAQTEAQTEAQRINTLAAGYVQAVPLSSFPAIRGIVRKAVTARRDGEPLYGDEEIADALTQLATDGRSVTMESLRLALEGLPPLPARPRVTAMDERASVTADLLARVRARESAPPATFRNANTIEGTTL